MPTRPPRMRGDDNTTCRPKVHRATPCRAHENKQSPFLSIEQRVIDEERAAFSEGRDLNFEFACFACFLIVLCQ